VVIEMIFYVYPPMVGFFYCLKIVLFIIV